MEYVPFPKIPRLSRDIVITEKLDGTTGSVFIQSTAFVDTMPEKLLAEYDGFRIYAGSHTRWLTPESDNYGFARWVQINVLDLMKLGEGHHFGEWWGGGIQRGYGLLKNDKRFSLFNVSKWGDPEARPRSCFVVPQLYHGPFDTFMVGDVLATLQRNGSFAAPGFMDPEGIVIYHTAGNLLFKKTIKDDEYHKGNVICRLPKPPQVQRVKVKGKDGRRNEQLPFEGPDRRKPREQTATGT